MNNSSHTFSRRLVYATTILGIAGSAALTVPATADHGLPHVVQLARGAFLDDVSLTIRSRIHRHGTDAINIRDASDIVVLHITIEPGGVAPWHTHSGTGFLVNLGPGTLTNYLGDDCIPRLFYPGDAFVDPGHGTVHAVRNDSLEEVVIVATFLGVQGAPVIPDQAPFHCPVL
jgi:quercetin dioxygenase-like cupin family protein